MDKSNADVSNPIERDKKGDIYSFAITLYEIMSKCKAWSLESLDKANPLMISRVVCSGKRPEIPADTIEKFEGSTMMLDLINRCWLHDYNQRPTFSDISLHLAKNQPK